MSEALPKADLIVANNVLAHVPDINDFVGGIARLLKPRGQASVEFPHLLKLLHGNQFDTIYHEHYSYFSLNVVIRIFQIFGLEVIDVEKISTHGGSLRIWASHSSTFPVSSNVANILLEEKAFGLESIDCYNNFQAIALQTKLCFQEFLLSCKKDSKRVFAYGAAAKGNTLLNFCGIDSNLIPAVADKAVSKQGKYLPGSHIPIVSPEQLCSYNPEIVIAFPWNIIDELRLQMPHYNFYTLIPSPKFYKSQSC